VVICDWHYVRADQTAVYFAMKGLDVVSCSWKIRMSPPRKSATCSGSACSRNSRS